MTQRPYDITVPAGNLAPAGISGDIVSVLRAPELGHTADEALTDRSVRSFRVHCVLSRETTFGRSVSMTVDAGDGGSFFRVPSDVARFFVQTPIGELVFNRNAAGELAIVFWEGEASSLQAARSHVLRALTPVLDHFSYLGNAPILVGRVVVEDVAQKAVLCGYQAPYRDVTIGPGYATLRIELLPIYGLYREAKNSSSAFYRFLCYHKILEGIYRRFRPDVFRRARELGVQLPATRETIPEHPELRRFLPGLIGRGIKDFFDNDLQRAYRDAVAHFTLDDGTTLNPSDVETISRFQNIMLPTELGCRVAIEQQERYYADLDQRGVRVG